MFLSRLLSVGLHHLLAVLLLALLVALWPKQLEARLLALLLVVLLGHWLLVEIQRMY
jgi:hypothetical protein